MPTVALHTLGCKLNHAETSTIARQFVDRGYTVVDAVGRSADVVVINTCTVTGRADRECRQVIRRALRSAASPYVIVTGCYAQLEPERIASINGVNLVLGAREKFDCFRYAGGFEPSAPPEVHVSEIRTVDDFGPAQTGMGDQTRAYLKIQDGCDYTCSFCTIPLARGGSRSQSVAASLSQAHSLVARGFREVILTGVNVGDYGRKDGTSLLELVRELDGVEGLDRLRISSIEPNLLTDALIDHAASGSSRLCDHFHIPLQSGSDAILRAMRRRYTTADFASRIAAIRRLLPHAGIGVDVIVGFPGETDARFEETHRFLSDLPVSYLHVFTYSERPNTPAATMGAPVPADVRHRRNEKLRILGQKKRHDFAHAMVGRTVEILTESAEDQGRRHGFTTNYVRVSLPADACGSNILVQAEILEAGEPACPGRCVGGGGGL